MKINAKWHKDNPVPKNPTPEQRLQWHVNHERECACRPIPKTIKKVMMLRRPKLIVAVLVKNSTKYLLVREEMESGRNRWIVPGGKVEFGESLDEAAKREILEETALKIDKINFLTFWEAIFPKFNYHTVIFFYSARTKEKKLGKDIEGKVQEAKWFTKSEIKNLPLVESANWLFKSGFFR